MQDEGTVSNDLLSKHHSDNPHPNINDELMYGAWCPTSVEQVIRS